MPQVQPVGALAQPLQRPGLQQAHQPAGRPVGAGDLAGEGLDDGEGAHGCDDERRLGPRPAVGRRLAGDAGQDEQAGQAGPPRRPAHPAQPRRLGLEIGPLRRAPVPQGPGGAQHEAEGVGVGAHVDARDGGAVAHQTQGPGGRGQRQPQCQDGPGPDPPARDAPRQEDDDDQRPHQIELLLHRQRPHIGQQQRLGLVEVGRSGHDLHPVVDQQDRADDLAPHGQQDVAAQAGGRSHGRGDRDEQGGHDPAQAPGPEALDVDAPRGAPLDEQEAGNEEARDDEEGVDPHHSARQEPGQQVVDEDDGDGDGAQSVEAADAAPRGGAGGRRAGGALSRGHALCLSESLEGRQSALGGPSRLRRRRRRAGPCARRCRPQRAVRHENAPAGPA